MSSVNVCPFTWFAPLSQRDVALPSIAFAATSVVLLGDPDATQPVRDSAGPSTFSSWIDQGDPVGFAAVRLILMCRAVCGCTFTVSSTAAFVPDAICVHVDALFEVSTL
jgi:hypothetical protein